MTLHPATRATFQIKKLFLKNKRHSTKRKNLLRFWTQIPRAKPIARTVCRGVILHLLRQFCIYTRSTSASLCQHSVPPSSLAPWRLFVQVVQENQSHAPEAVVSPFTSFVNLNSRSHPHLTSNEGNKTPATLRTALNAAPMPVISILPCVTPSPHGNRNYQLSQHRAHCGPSREDVIGWDTMPFQKW